MSQVFNFQLSLQSFILCKVKLQVASKLELSSPHLCLAVKLQITTTWLLIRLTLPFVAWRRSDGDCETCGKRETPC